MKTTLKLRALTWPALLLATLLFPPPTSLAQGTAFTYQGRLHDGTNAANDVFDFQFRLFSSSSPVGIPLGNTVVEDSGVTNGLFTATLDFGANAFNGDPRWLEISVRPGASAGAFTALTPLQPLTAPYAIRALNVGTNGLAAGTYANAVSFSDPGNSFTGNGTGLTNVNAASLGGLSRSDFWQLGGNQVTAGQFLGSTNDQPVDLRVKGVRALRLESGGDSATDADANPDGAPNVIGGAAHNFVTPGVVGATIGGGGASDYSGGGFTNSVLGDFGTVGGGADNAIQLEASFGRIGGGFGNTLQRGARSSTIGGGDFHTIQTNSQYAGIHGGQQNTIHQNAQNATIAGGFLNFVRPDAQYATISGGAQNIIQTNADYATIAGGQLNSATNHAFAAGRRAKANHTGAFVWADSQDADFASTGSNQFLIRASGGVGINTNATTGAALNVAGTVQASVLQAGSFVGGGGGLTNVNAATLGGASSSNFWQLGGNTGTTAGTHFIGTTDNQPLELKVSSLRALRLEPNVTSPNVIAGHAGNSVTPGFFGSTIAGGGHPLYTNRVAGNYSTVGGGRGNTAADAFATVGGGADNQAGSFGATVGGGVGNQVAAYGATVSGGAGNISGLYSSYSTIVGGAGNEVGTNSGYTMIAGGTDNSIADNSLACVIAGGIGNTIATDSVKSLIGGGEGNTVGTFAESATITGGRVNHIRAGSPSSFIGGGDGNVIGTNSPFSTIGGGSLNTIASNSAYAIVPGGQSNTATNSAFAAGRRAKANHQGAFVWADSQNNDFASTTTNQFNVRAGGGARFVTAGAGLSADGPMLADAGSANAPGLAFDTDPATGMFNPSANSLAFASGGAERMRVASTGRVGLGTTNPAAYLHVASAGSTPQLHLGQNDSGNAFTRMRLSVGNSNLWDVAAGGNNNVLNFYYIPAANDRMTLDTNGNLFIDGTLNPPSDRNAKQNFRPMDALEVLAKVAALPIQTWAYKNLPATRHIGPVAQDFHAAFGLNGDDDKHIATVDADGVALAAIQGLNQKLEQENAEMRKELQEIKQLLAAIARKGTNP